MFESEILFYSGHEIILECALDELVEEVRAEQFVNVCSGEVQREWLIYQTSSGTNEQ